MGRDESLPGGAIDAFLISRQWRDGQDGVELIYWATSDRGPLRIVLTGEQAVCFVERNAALGPEFEPSRAEPYRRREVALTNFAGASVDALYFRSRRDLQAFRARAHGHGVRLHETDVKPADRFLMERFITASVQVLGEPMSRPGHLELVNPRLRRGGYAPRLRHVSLDIETEGLEGRLYSIGASSPGASVVFMVGDSPEGPGESESVLPGDAAIRWCADERTVLAGFFAWLREVDPDVIIGWNVIGFDLRFLLRRSEALGVRFDIARGRERSQLLAPRDASGIWTVRAPGRVVMDGIEWLRAAFWTFESFELEAVARDLLGRGKQISSGPDRVEEINRLHAEDRLALAAYNLADCRLVEGIFERTGLVEFAVERARLTGLALGRIGGAVAAFDNLYLPRLHRRGRVAPDVADARALGNPSSPGGYVLDSEPGLYDNVLVLDFKSLYPSIVRTYRIDPFGLLEPGEEPIPGFLDARFRRDDAILPELLAELWDARDAAKRDGNRALSQAIKIIMNSCYGVLAASSCRFHDARLASSITRRGHEVIRDSRAEIHRRGHRVIYGDTDSLFVLLGAGVSEADARRIGEGLAADLNHWWRERLEREHRIESFMEVEFETLYLRFLMPTVRGSEAGSKKRYAGMVRGADGGLELEFKGLESVRTDWTPLARRFQRELYRRVFLGEPFEDYVRDVVHELIAGRHDDGLVYRKRLRRAVADYQHNVPPHVQAAAKLARPGRYVRYVITRGGPEPILDDDVIPTPDYDHYRDRQLAPVADGILHFLDTSFEALTSAQMEIF